MRRTADLRMASVSFAVLAGVLCGAWLQGVSAARAAVMSRTEADLTLGGACPNRGCENKTCANTGCTATEEFCSTVANTTKCRKTLKNNYAKCGAAGSQQGFTCSETSQGGCVTVKVGDQTADKKCPEAQCASDGGTCGDTSFKCTATACET